MRYALIKNGVVENVVEWSGSGDQFEGYTCVNIDGFIVGPGWFYSGGEFSSPVEETEVTESVIS